MALYNEWEPYPAAWLRNLIAAGHIAPGRVDERSIVELTATDLVGVVQFHAFAGLGGWSHALRLAGWPDDRPVWTASCPCQPFSDAGKGLGVDDERHLWPVVFELVRECRPSVLFGEQVASRAGLDWLAAVRADLEGAGYAVGAADLCAAGVGAPHIRQRLYFVGVRLADGDVQRRERLGLRLLGRGPFEDRAETAGRGEADCGVADADRAGLAGRAIVGGERGHRGPAAERGGGIRYGLVDAASGGAPAAQQPGRRSRALGAGAGGGRLGDADREHAGRDGGRAPRAEASCGGERGANGPFGDEPRAPGRGFWADAELVACRDGKSRPVGPGIQPLAHGVSARVGKLRAAGNAIVPQVAAAFIRSVMPWIDERRAA